MPSTKGLETFVRKKQITDEEWDDLIEDRRELIKPHLDFFTLPELGSLFCVKDGESCQHELKYDVSVSTGDPRFSLKTQGIFRKQPWCSVKQPSIDRYGTMRVWGLARSGLWVLVTIGFIEEDKDSHGFKVGRAINVDIVESDLSTIVRETNQEPQLIWEELGKAIQGWAESRKQIYDKALDLSLMVQFEELAFSLIPKEA